MSADDVCRAAIPTLAVDGAALTAISDRGDRAVLASSGRWGARLVELQLTAGEGPCFDAHAGHRPVLVADLATAATRDRWAGFVPAAVEAGVRAVFSLPLQAGVSCFGTLMVYRDHPGRLDPDQLRDGLVLAETGLWALLDTIVGIPAGEPAEPFGSGQDEVFQASGMISVQLGVGVDEALVRLRAHAYSHDRPLSDISRDVIARRLRFEPTATPP